MTVFDNKSKLKAVFGDLREECIRSCVEEFIEDTYSYKNVKVISIIVAQDIVFTVQANSVMLAMKFKLSSHESIEYLPALYQVLRLSGVPCPEPVLTQDNRIVSMFKAFYCILYQWCVGCATHPDNLAHCKAVALALARIHLATSEFQLSECFPSAPYPICRRVKLPDNLWAVPERISQKFSLLKHEINAIIGQSDVLFDAFEKENYHLILTHEELRADNCFFTGDDLTSIIDWEDCRRLYKVDVVAQTAIWYCLNPKANQCRPPNIEFIRSFFSEYLKQDILSELEMEIIRPLLAFHIARTAIFWPEQVFEYIDLWLNIVYSI